MIEQLAIITVTYNSSAVIEEFMISLFKQSYFNWQLYLVDSASTDDTLKKISASIDEKIVVLPQAINVGFAEGNNIGIRQAISDGCDSVLLINNDTEFDTDFLSKLLLNQKAYPEMIITPKIYYAGTKQIWCAGGGFKPIQAYAAYHRGEKEYDVGQYDQDYSCDFVPMCCVLIPVNIWQKVGELDNKFFIYSEDADWFYRAKELDIKLIYCYKPVLYHKVSSLTGGAQSQIGASYGTRNRVYFLRKHFHGVQKVFFLGVYFFGMIVKVLIQKYTVKEFKWRLGAFFKGFRL